MSKAINISYLIRQIEKLDRKSQMDLINKIKAIIRQEGPSKTTHQITELHGLGSDIWRNINIDEYLENERAWD